MSLLDKRKLVQKARGGRLIGSNRHVINMAIPYDSSGAGLYTHGGGMYVQGGGIFDIFKTALGFFKPLVKPVLTQVVPAFFRGGPVKEVIKSVAKEVAPTLINNGFSMVSNAIGKKNPLAGQIAQSVGNVAGSTIGNIIQNPGAAKSILKGTVKDVGSQLIQQGTQLAYNKIAEKAPGLAPYAGLAGQLAAQKATEGLHKVVGNGMFLHGSKGAGLSKKSKSKVKQMVKGSGLAVLN